MWKLANAILLLLVLCCQAKADDFLEQVTFNTPQPPGSVAIRYGGLRGLFFDEIEDQIIDLWTRQINLTIRYSPIFDDELPYIELGAFISDTRGGGRWWERSWYYSLPTEKSGAPPLRVYNLDRVAIDLWFFQINSKLRVKVKELDFSLPSGSVFSRSPPRDYWRVRIRPQMSLGLPYGISRAGLSLVFEYYLSRVKSFDIELFVRYRQKNAFMLGFEFTMFRW